MTPPSARMNGLLFHCAVRKVHMKGAEGKRRRAMNENPQEKPRFEVATLGGGCFWCLEAVFELLRGVTKVESGYCGGSVANPSYHQVCHGTTGHAEVVQVTFDPDAVAFREVLEVFFA